MLNIGCRRSFVSVWGKIFSLYHILCSWKLFCNVYSGYVASMNEFKWVWLSPTFPPLLCYLVHLYCSKVCLSFSLQPQLVKTSYFRNNTFAFFPPFTSPQSFHFTHSLCAFQQSLLEGIPVTFHVSSSIYFSTNQSSRNLLLNSSLVNHSISQNSQLLSSLPPAWEQTTHTQPAPYQLPDDQLINCQPSLHSRLEPLNRP